MTENPKSWSTTRKMPHCFEEVEQTVTMVWNGMWQPKKYSIEFYCQIGKRNVSLNPRFHSRNDSSSGCEGCPAFTPPETPQAE